MTDLDIARPATVTRRIEPAPRPDDPLAQAEVCGWCPKLCRPACPVEAATGREAVAPHRISATVRDSQRAGWTVETLTVAASCTGCAACTNACLAGVVLPVESRAARAQAVTQGVLLPAAERLRARIAATGSPRAGRGKPDADTLDADTHVADTTVFLGCAVLDHDLGVANALLSLFAAAGADPHSLGRGEPCCGAVALDLGLADEATALATTASATLTPATSTANPTRATSVVGSAGPAGGPTDLPPTAGGAVVVAVSPGCARMIREEWPRLGLAAPRVLTPAEWLDAELAAGRLVVKPDVGPLALTWHAPCTLSRGLGVVDAPLRVLAALGVEVRQPRETGAETRCSGGGAAYPLVDPEGAAAVARVRAADLARLGAPVVTACPEAARALRGAGLDVRDLLEVAADRVSTPA